MSVGQMSEGLMSVGQNVCLSNVSRLHLCRPNPIFCLPLICLSVKCLSGNCFLSKRHRTIQETVIAQIHFITQCCRYFNSFHNINIISQISGKFLYFLNYFQKMEIKKKLFSRCPFRETATPPVFIIFATV